MSSSSHHSPLDATALAAYRANKDTFLGSSPHSPIRPSDRPGFAGLRYFDHAPRLAFTVPLEPGDGAAISVATSDGAERTYRRAGSLRLDIGGTEVTLTLYDTGHSGYFLPFRDATSGNTTYAAGRYLDVQPNADDTVTIDFNLAYNPFCAYQDAYSCALPPPENWLEVPIDAGERTYEPSTRNTQDRETETSV